MMSRARMIDRRRLLMAVPGLLLTAAPVGAQEAGKAYRIAVLAPSPDPVNQFRAIVVPELAKRGFVEGRNLRVTTHVGLSSEMPKLAAEALAARPDIVVASTINAVRAVMAASPSVPIVMSFIGEDPVAVGLAQSYARPGGRVTGMTIQSYQLDGKRLTLLHEAFPSARRIAILAKRPPRHLDSIQEMRRVAELLRVEIQVFHADAPGEYADAFRAMRIAGLAAVTIAAGPEFVSDAALLAHLARESKLPAIGEETSMARDGLLLGYGPNRVVFRRRTADYVARILGGTAPGEIPIEEPTQFELAVNLKTAKALGLTVPPSILARADEVIE
jgi:putative ABC transport system substrate-binding protein